MKIGQISQCTKVLDFKPRTDWPEVLPAVAWGDTLVAGFRSGSLEKPCLYLDVEVSLEVTLAQLYPQIGFIEIARLWQLVSADFNWAEFCSALQLRFTDDWPRIFSVIKKTPIKIVDWLESKTVGARDLAPLKAFQDDAKLALWFDLASKIVSFQPSRSEGVQTLEWLVDLILMNRSVDLTSATTFAEAQSRTRAARYPNATETRVAAETLLAELPWPAKSKATVARQGDRDGFEIKLFVHSKDELQKQIASLQNVESQWGPPT